MLAFPKYHYSEFQGHNPQRFDESENLINYLNSKNFNSKRKYEIHLNLSKEDIALEDEIKKHFSKSTFIDDSLSKDKSLISQSINGINL